MDIQKLLDEVTDLILAKMADELRDLRADVYARIDETVARIPAGKDGRDGAPGESVAHELIEVMVAKIVGAYDINALVHKQVTAAVDAIPVPRDGRDGKDGKDGINGRDGKDGERGERGQDGKDGINGRDGKDGERGERGLDGKDGKDGKDGINGRDGKDGADGERGPEGPMPTVDLSEVVEIIRADPEMMAALRGSPGLRGEDGAPGKDGRDGIDGRDGANGATVSPDDVHQVVKQHFAGWALEMERLTTDRHQRVIEAIPIPRDGRDGKDGRPGLGLDDFEATIDQGEDGRTMTLTLQAGGRTRAMSWRMPAIIDRGVYAPSGRYERGDAITYGGSLWICQRDATPAKPGDNGDWRLAVRRGKDGRDAA